jgi:hypothetical protein
MSMLCSFEWLSNKIQKSYSSAILSMPASLSPFKLNEHGNEDRKKVIYAIMYIGKQE